MPSKRVSRMKAARRLGSNYNPLPTTPLVTEVASYPDIQTASSDTISAANVRPYPTTLCSEPATKIELSAPTHLASVTPELALATPPSPSSQRSFTDKALDIIKTVVNLGAPVYALACVLSTRIRSLCWWMC